MCAAPLCLLPPPGRPRVARCPPHLLLLAAAGAGPGAAWQLGAADRRVVQAEGVEEPVAAAALEVGAQLPAKPGQGGKGR